MGELERLLAKGVPWPTVGRIILLLSPQALGLTIPMALLVGLLIGLGPAVDRPRGGGAPGVRRQPLSAAAPGPRAGGPGHRRHHVRDDRRASRTPTRSTGRSSSRTLTKKVESDVKPRVFFQEFPNWVLYPRNEARAWAGRVVGRPARQYVEARRGRDLHGPARPDCARPGQAHGRARPDRRHAITRPPGPASRAPTRFSQERHHSASTPITSFRRSTWPGA